MSRTSSPLPRKSRWTFWTGGNSSRQVVHHVAQKKSITTLPRRSARLTVLPARSGSEKAGAAFGGVYGCICTLAKSGGAAPQGALVADQRIPAAGTAR